MRGGESLRRYVSVAIVATTVLTAVVGYFASTASRAGDKTSARAERLAVQALAEAVRAREEANRAYGQLVVAEELRRRAASVLQQSVFADAGRSEALLAKQREWERVAARVRKLVPARAAAAAAMIEDVAVRDRFFAETHYESLRLAGLRDASTDESAAWGGQVASYTAILTLLAVALYLLGFSLSGSQRPRAVFVIVGGSLSLIALGWAATTRASSPSPIPAEAAAEYARAVVALQSARTPDEYRAAERHFSAAIRLRPDHAWAYQGRSDAIFSASSPQTAGAESVTTPDALRRSTADAQRALDLGLENYVVLANLGFDRLALGLASEPGDQRARLLDAGVGHLRRALRLLPESPELHYDLALGLLAQGRTEEARATYRDAIRQTLYEEVDGIPKRRDETRQEGYVADALTNLERLKTSRPELGNEILATKELIVGSVGRGQIRGPAEHDPLTGIALDIFPSDVQATRLSKRELDTDEHRLSARWWIRGHLGWSALAYVSGPLAAPSADVNGGLREDSVIPGTYFFLRDALSAGSGDCLQSGRYRLELYVDGKLVATRATPADLPPSRLRVIPALDLLICAPPDWHVLTSGYAGLLSGVTSKDRRSGVYLFRVAVPLSIARLDAAQQARGVLRRLVDRFAALFPAEPTFDSPLEVESFLDLDGLTRLGYSYDGGEIDAYAGATDDGTVIAAILFGPRREFFDSGTWLLLINSLARNE